MGKRVTLHLQQNTTLERVATILDLLSTDPYEDLEQVALMCNLGVSVLQKNVFPFLRNLSILDKSTKTPGLTPQGKVAAAILQKNPDLLGDFFHSFIYQLHLGQPEKRFSWAYATVLQKLWDRQEVVLSTAEKKSLVGETIQAASLMYQQSSSNIAFSDTSIAGILNWLRGLSPSVIESQGKSEVFSRRYFCAAPIVVKSVDTLYKQQRRTYGVKILLKEEIKDTICQMLLLDPTGLEGSLDNAKRTYDYDCGSLFDWGYEGGYGQWITLTKSPEWTELL
jgi:hypothetical protein